MSTHPTSHGRVRVDITLEHLPLSCLCSWFDNGDLALDAIQTPVPGPYTGAHSPLVVRYHTIGHLFTADARLYIHGLARTAMRQLQEAAA